MHWNKLRVRVVCNTQQDYTKSFTKMSSGRSSGKKKWQMVIGPLSPPNQIQVHHLTLSQLNIETLCKLSFLTSALKCVHVYFLWITLTVWTESCKGTLPWKHEGTVRHLTGLLAQHCLFKGHTFKLGPTNSPICERCHDKEETTSHTVSMWSWGFSWTGTVGLLQD